MILTWLEPELELIQVTKEDTRTEAVREGGEEVLEVLMMTMGKLVIGLNDWPTRTASNLQQSHLDLTSCQLFPGCSLDCISFFHFVTEIIFNWAFWMVDVLTSSPLAVIMIQIRLWNV